MSSDLYFCDSSFYHNYSPEIVSSDGDLFFQDPFSSFCDSSTDIFSESSNNLNNQNLVHNSSSLDHLTPNLLSSSPPCHQLENLSLYSSTHWQQPVGDCENLGGCSSLGNGYNNFSGLDALGIKTEECQMGFESCYNNQPFFMPHSYSSVENVAKMMQRSFSSNSFEGKPDPFFQTPFDALLESPNYQNQAFSPPESSFLSGHMRRVCSTGDLQNIRTPHSTQRSFSSPLASESSLMEEGNFKVCRYSAEERKDRISKYRAKRTQRNFTKTIKYACRKTLADNRPRIRGRFARNDEMGEIPKAACSNRQDEDELWQFDGLNGEEDDHGGIRGRDFVNSFELAQFQYYSN